MHNPLVLRTWTAAAGGVSLVATRTVCPPMISSSATSCPTRHALGVADITQQRCWDGWLYVVVVLDASSRRIVGWSMADHLRTELVLDGGEPPLRDVHVLGVTGASRLRG